MSGGSYYKILIDESDKDKKNIDSLILDSNMGH
jgi:hypothetical protein